jgi:hypothetical protein
MRLRIFDGTCLKLLAIAGQEAAADGYKKAHWDPRY